MELPPPTGRHKHPVWSTPKPILTALFILHLPDGRHRIATAHDTLELETMDLERAAMHLGMKASHQLNK